MASTKRKISTTIAQLPGLPPSKKQNVSSHDHQSFNRVILNPADCDLAFNIEDDGITGHALYEKGFAYCWSGARANVGITGGKYCFGCKIISNQPVKMDNTLGDQHVSRVGISRGDELLGNLGETNHSFGYDGTGKFSDAGQFVHHGERFGVGDTIVCLVDLESKPCASLEFSKNGKRLGVAKRFVAGTNGLEVIDSPAGERPWLSALFPHVLLKNTVVKMQFSLKDGLVPEEGYKPWDSAVEDGKAVIGPGLCPPNNCEVIMMVGLPASGKTTWAEKRAREYPEKRYIVLGTDLALDQMKVQSLKRKFSYSERFDTLMDKAIENVNTLLSRASKIPRNYIIDQTNNVYKTARLLKMKPFYYFHKIAVVVFPRRKELKRRAEKRLKEMGSEMPSEETNKMIEKFVLPMTEELHVSNEHFDEVIFTELGRDEAQKVLDKMKLDLSLF